MKKKVPRTFSREFKLKAIERLEAGESGTDLSRERTPSRQLGLGKHGRAAILDALRHKLRCRNCSSKPLASAVVDAPLAPPPAQNPWSDRART